MSKKLVIDRNQYFDLDRNIHVSKQNRTEQSCRVLPRPKPKPRPKLSKLKVKMSQGVNYYFFKQTANF